MKSKQFIVAFLAFPVAIYAVIFSFYLVAPQHFYFRAYELFDQFVYTGFSNTQQKMYETGDSARGFLFQRYGQENTISVDMLGYRKACYGRKNINAPNVLLLGDSQLFGSGTDDQGIFSTFLCKAFDANIYNGAGRLGLDLPRSREMNFDSILFTAAENNSLNGLYCAGFDNFVAHYEDALHIDDFMIKKPTAESWNKHIVSGNDWLMGYLQNRVSLIFSVSNIKAPENHLTIARYQKQSQAVADDVICAEKLSNFFKLKHISVGFLYFPSHQTIYTKEAKLDVDKQTLDFIDDVSIRFSVQQLKTFNTKLCLLNAKNSELVYQMHDTHLNSNGYSNLARCLNQTELKRLFVIK